MGDIRLPKVSSVRRITDCQDTFVCVDAAWGGIGSHFQEKFHKMAVGRSVGRFDLLFYLMMAEQDALIGRRRA